MKKELKYEYQIGQDWIKELVDFEESSITFYKFVAKSLDCEVKDLALISVVPEFEEIDEEGWDLMYFFPEGAKIDVKVINTDYVTPGGMAIGEVLEVTYEGEKFIAEHNASPYGVWAKYQPD